MGFYHAQPADILYAADPEFVVMPASAQYSRQSETELAAMVQTILAIPLHAHFGLRLIARGEDWSRLAFTAGARTWTHTGGVHGGVLSLLLEPPALLAVAPSLAPGELPVTIDIHIQIMRPVPPGAEVVLEGRVLKRGRSVAFCASQALVAGALCATASITKSILTAPDRANPACSAPVSPSLTNR